MTSKKCGYVALLGRPNAGKSTLLNAMIGTKIAAVSAKPQTTRNKILGIDTFDNAQIIYIDTPGLHEVKSLHKINKLMNKVAWGVLNDAELICYLIDVANPWHEEDEIYLKNIFEKSHSKILIIVSQIDKVKKELAYESYSVINKGLDRLIENLEKDVKNIRERLLKKHPYEMSAKRPDDLLKFRELLLENMPIGEWLYAQDDLTDLPQKFICSEMIREQIFRQLGQELPYSIAVKIDTFKLVNEKTMIQATIVVQKENHKGIVIGKAGLKLKSIGTEARINLEKHLGTKVFLELFIKVQEGWIDNDKLIAEYAEINIPDLK